MTDNTVDADMISCWRTNYNLDKHTPADAARWWDANNHGQCPAGAVAALGVCLIEIERLRAMLADAADEIESWALYASEYFRAKHDLAGTLKRFRDAAMKEKP